MTIDGVKGPSPTRSFEGAFELNEFGLSVTRQADGIALWTLGASTTVADGTETIDIYRLEAQGRAVSRIRFDLANSSLTERFRVDAFNVVVSAIQTSELTSTADGSTLTLAFSFSDISVTAFDDSGISGASWRLSADSMTSPPASLNYSIGATVANFVSVVGFSPPSVAADGAATFGDASIEDTQLDDAVVTNIQLAADGLIVPAVTVDFFRDNNTSIAPAPDVTYLFTAAEVSSVAISGRDAIISFGASSLSLTNGHATAGF